MRMRLNTSKRILASLAGIVLFLAPHRVEATENIDWPTYYPSPYGSYRELKSTRTTNLASQTANSVATLTSQFGYVGIGTATPANRIHVVSPAGIANQTMTAGFIGANNWGVQMGGFKDAAGVWQNLSAIQAYQVGGPATGLLALNPAGTQPVMIRGNLIANCNLTVRGGGQIDFHNGGVTKGAYKVAYSAVAPTGFYAVFAPDT